MTYEVINLRNHKSHGKFDTLDEAKGCVLYDRLAAWEIWAVGPMFINTVVAYCDPADWQAERRCAR
jgi:hypothetical protein